MVERRGFEPLVAAVKARERDLGWITWAALSSSWIRT
jgi:hypothetical protein